MLFLGKVDGSMDVWDFTDSSFTPSVTLMSSPSRITRCGVYCGAVRYVGDGERERDIRAYTCRYSCRTLGVGMYVPRWCGHCTFGFLETISYCVTCRA